MRSLLALAWRFRSLIIIAALALALAAAVNVARDRGADLKAAKTDLAAAASRANEWKVAYDAGVVLARQSAIAHAAEQAALINLARAAGTAKQGIANAPGAADRYRYSDAAYGFMRSRPAEAARDAAAPGPDVDGR